MEQNFAMRMWPLGESAFLDSSKFSIFYLNHMRIMLHQQLPATVYENLANGRLKQIINRNISSKSNIHLISETIEPSVLKTSVLRSIFLHWLVSILYVSWKQTDIVTCQRVKRNSGNPVSNFWNLYVPTGMIVANKKDGAPPCTRGIRAVKDRYLTAEFPLYRRGIVQSLTTPSLHNSSCLVGNSAVKYRSDPALWLHESPWYKGALPRADVQIRAYLDIFGQKKVLFAEGSDGATNHYPT